MSKTKILHYYFNLSRLFAKMIRYKYLLLNPKLRNTNNLWIEHQTKHCFSFRASLRASKNTAYNIYTLPISLAFVCAWYCGFLSGSWNCCQWRTRRAENHANSAYSVETETKIMCFFFVALSHHTRLPPWTFVYVFWCVCFLGKHKL